MPPRPHPLHALILLAPAACGLALSQVPAHAQQTFADEVAQASYVEPIVAGGEPDAAAAAKQAEEIELVRGLARHRGGHAEALAQIIQMSRSFSDSIAAELLDELAAAHLAAGDLNLAAEVRRVLAEQYPGTPRAQDSLLWLVRLYSSSEMVHARRQPSQAAVDMLRQLPPNADVANARTHAAVKRQQPRQHQAAPSSDQPAAAYAIHLATQSMSRHPELADNAALAYQRAVAARLAGQQKQAQAFLSPLKHRRGGDLWGDCARMEAWLESGAKDRSPKPTATCVYADDPPQLDGVLDEPFWQLALPLPLKPADRAVLSALKEPGGKKPTGVEPAEEISGEEKTVGGVSDADSAFHPEQSRYSRVASGSETPPTDLAETPAPASQVQLAYDRRYLYVAIVCEKAPGQTYPADRGPRPRDADVAALDHVCLRLDVDRDYASYFELLIDSRGWTADRCWGDAAWNPEWFVAAGARNGDAASPWIVELAIPWSELTLSPPTSASAWACSVARAIPGSAAASQSWVGPPSAAPAPDSFGVLRFE